MKNRKDIPPGSKIFLKAIKKRGYHPVHYDAQFCQLYFDNKKSVILYKGKAIKGCDALIPRLNVYENVEMELSFVKQFQLMGIMVINKYLPILGAMNKLRSLQILTKAKVPMPKTIIVRRFEYLDEAIKLVGDYPVIIKVPFGTHGKGVAIIESRRSLYSALDTLWKYRNSEILLIQEYIHADNASDYRAFVVGDKVVAAMQRMAVDGDFRSNLHLGGAAIPVKLTLEEEKLAVKASRAVGLDYSGVDLLHSSRGPLVLEVNPTPGLQGIMKATGLDIPDKILDYITHNIRNKA